MPITEPEPAVSLPQLTDFRGWFWNMKQYESEMAFKCELDPEALKEAGVQCL